MLENSDNTNSSAASSESASTPASAIPADETAGVSQQEGDNSPLSFGESVWDKLGEESQDKTAEPQTPEIPAKEEGEPADLPADEPDKTDAEKTPESEKTEKDEEDEALEEIFKAEELDKIDKDSIVASQPSRRTKAAAARNFDLAEIVKSFQSADKPLAEVISSLEQIAPERFTSLKSELAHSLVDANPEATFQRAYVAKMLKVNPSFDWQKDGMPSLDDIVSGKAGTGSTPQAKEQTDIDNLAAQMTESFGFDWRDTANDDLFDEDQLAMVKMVRALETEKGALKAEGQTTSEKLQNLEKQVTEFQKEKQEREFTKLETELKGLTGNYRQSIETKLIPHITKHTGLEITPDDTSAMKAFKEAHLEQFTGTQYERENNQNSRFEDFAYNESSVKTELGEIVERLVKAQAEEAKARVKGDKETAAKFAEKAAEEKLPMMETLAQASKEYSQRFIKPTLDLIESLSTGLINKNTEAASRVEITSGGGQMPPQAVSQPPKSGSLVQEKDAWDRMAEDYQRETNLRANG